MIMNKEAAAILARKKRSRIGHKASTTRLLNLATTALGAEESDEEELSLLKQRITEKIQIFEGAGQ